MNNNSFSLFAWNIFEKSIQDYHVHDDVDISEKNPYEKGSLEHIWRILFVTKILIL